MRLKASRQQKQSFYPLRALLLRLRKIRLLYDLQKFLRVRNFLSLPVRFIEQMQFAGTPTRNIPAKKAFSLFGKHRRIDPTMNKNIIFSRDLLPLNRNFYRKSPVTKKLQAILDAKRSKLYMKIAKGSTRKLFKTFMTEQQRPIA